MTSNAHRFRIGDEEYVVTSDDIRAVANREDPRRINAYFVEIDGVRFPPKQLLRGAVATKRAFDTGVAVRALRALGFDVNAVA
jgi:hypothetical protein